MPGIHCSRMREQFRYILRMAYIWKFACSKIFVFRGLPMKIFFHMHECWGASGWFLAAVIEHVDNVRGRS